MYAVDPNQNQNQNGYGDLSGGQFAPSIPNVPYQGSFMTPQIPQQQSSNQLPPTGFQQQTQTFQTQLSSAQPTQFTQAPQQPVVAAPEPIKQKPPLPEEYIYLQTVLNELRTQCGNATNNPVSQWSTMWISHWFNSFRMNSRLN